MCPKEGLTGCGNRLHMQRGKQEAARDDLTASRRLD